MTSSGLEMPPVQKAFQIWSIWPRRSPVTMVVLFCGHSAVAGRFYENAMMWKITVRCQGATSRPDCGQVRFLARRSAPMGDGPGISERNALDLVERYLLAAPII